MPPNFLQRIISTIILGPLFLASIYLNRWTYFGTFGVILTFCLVEFYNMFSTTIVTRDRAIGFIIAWGIYTLSFITLLKGIYFQYIITLPIFFFIAMSLSLYDISAKDFQSIGTMLIGFFYIAVPFSIMHFGTCTTESYNPTILFVVLLGVWATDTGAYLFGSTLGKHKLFERISQKKTWEGLFGGAFLCLCTMKTSSIAIKILQDDRWIVISIIIIISSVYGDLVESRLKRSVDIKDSSNIIPGHGGFLDRFDSFIFSIVAVVVYTTLYIKNS